MSLAYSFVMAPPSTPAVASMRFGRLSRDAGSMGTDVSLGDSEWYGHRCSSVGAVSARAVAPQESSLASGHKARNRWMLLFGDESYTPKKSQFKGGTS